MVRFSFRVSYFPAYDHLGPIFSLDLLGREIVIINTFKAAGELLGIACSTPFNRCTRLNTRQQINVRTSTTVDRTQSWQAKCFVGALLCRWK